MLHVYKRLTSKQIVGTPSVVTKHSVCPEKGGIKFTIDGKEITLFNVYSPQDKQLSLNLMTIPSENCLVIGDFNSHSTSWGYQENDNRGNEVEDWQLDNNLILINDPEDP